MIRFSRRCCALLFAQVDLQAQDRAHRIGQVCIATDTQRDGCSHSLARVSRSLTSSLLLFALCVRFQTRPVRVFRLICEQSVEERVVARAQRKLYLAAMVSSGAAAGSELGLEANALEKLTKQQLLSMLKFGSDTVFKSEGTIDDRDIDAILAGAQTNLMTDEAIDARAATELKRQSSLESVKQDCASFDSSNLKDVGLMNFKGEQVSRSPSARD